MKNRVREIYDAPNRIGFLITIAGLLLVGGAVLWLTLSRGSIIRIVRLPSGTKTVIVPGRAPEVTVTTKPVGPPVVVVVTPPPGIKAPEPTPRPTPTPKPKPTKTHKPKPTPTPRPNPIVSIICTKVPCPSISQLRGTVHVPHFKYTNQARRPDF